MTSGTRECTIANPCEECCRAIGPPPTPPPLQPGDAVWVRAVVEGVQAGVVHAAIHNRPVYMVDGGVVVSVPLSSIRRIEGEVKQ